VILGMLVEARDSGGRLLGLFAGTLSSMGMWAWVKVNPVQ